MVGHPASSINGAKLPTMRQVLLFCFHAIDKYGNRKDAFKETIGNVMTFWNMARIETICERSGERKLEKLWEEWRGLQKSKDKAAAGKVDNFKKDLISYGT